MKRARERKRPRQKGRGRGKRERVGRGKRCAAGVIHLLEKQGKRQIRIWGSKKISAP